MVVPGADTLAAFLARTDELLAVVDRQTDEMARLMMVYELLALRCDREAETARLATELALRLLGEPEHEVDLRDLV